MENFYKDPIKLIKMQKELSIIQNYFQDKKSGVVVECGTAEGHHQPSMYLERSMGWKFIGFEVDPRFWPILLKNRPNGLNLNLALSNTNQLSKFTISAWGGNSSLNHCDFHKKELISYKKTFEDGSYFKDIWVSTITWSNFIKRYKIPNVDLFILDVEGNELSVLEGMKGSEVFPDVMQVEFGYSDPQNKLINEKTKENFSGYKIIKDSMEELGYAFDYLTSNNLIFSKKDFWKDKKRPTQWIGEDERFDHFGYCFYDKEKCKKL